MFALVDGQKVKVGDYVCFKSDYEQCGKIVNIKFDMFDNCVLVLENEDEFGGDYIGGQTRTQQRAQDCWVE